MREKRLASTEVPGNAQPTGFQDGADQQCLTAIRGMWRGPQICLLTNSYTT